MATRPSPNHSQMGSPVSYGLFQIWYVVWTSQNLLRVMFSAQDVIATIVFRNTSDLACLTASMSNGVTIQTSSIPWATGGATMAFIAISGIASMAGSLGSATNVTAGSSASNAATQGSGASAPSAPY